MGKSQNQFISISTLGASTQASLHHIPPPSCFKRGKGITTMISLCASIDINLEKPKQKRAFELDAVVQRVFYQALSMLESTLFTKWHALYHNLYMVAWLTSTHATFISYTTSKCNVLYSQRWCLLHYRTSSISRPLHIVLHPHFQVGVGGRLYGGGGGDASRNSYHSSHVQYTCSESLSKSNQIRRLGPSMRQTVFCWILILKLRCNSLAIYFQSPKL